jgi:hypothetical protein
MDASKALAAFHSFNFDSNEGWKHYRLNLEIPPGREAAILERFKAKWYKREIVRVPSSFSHPTHPRWGRRMCWQPLEH